MPAPNAADKSTQYVSDIARAITSALLPPPVVRTVAEPIEASVVLTPTPAESEIAIALSEDTAPEAAIEITSWSDTALTDTP